MPVKKHLQRYFGFSKAETNGMIILIPLIFLILFLPKIYRDHFGIEYSNYEQDGLIADSLLAVIEGSFNEQPPVLEIELVPFNPNLASDSTLLRLGIPEFLTNRIINYRTKGGQFRIKSDLAKIYNFPDSLYSKLEEYILLPINRDKRKLVQSPVRLDEATTRSKPEPATPEEFISMDLNLADTTALKRLKGIGSSYSRRIVSYRNLLGGYAYLKQLREVYGMTDSLYDQIKSHLYLSDSLSVKRIPINLATFKELLAHPYLSFEQVKEIMNSKSASGKFNKPADLYRLKLLDSAAIERLLPYLSF